MSNLRKVMVRSLEEALEIVAAAILVTISDILRGCDWVLQVIREAFLFGGCLEFRPIG